MSDREIPRISGTLRAKSIQIPEVIWQAKGMYYISENIHKLYIEYEFNE